MNRGDGLTVASYFAEDGVVEECGPSPNAVYRGRDELATFFTGFYGQGLRVAPGGAPIVNDEYVAEPLRFHNGNQPGRGAAMLVLEIGADNRFAHEWMIGWTEGPKKTFAVIGSPSATQPNAPPRRVTEILENCLAAIDRGDGRGAAAYFAPGGTIEEMDKSDPVGAETTYAGLVRRPVRLTAGAFAGVTAQVVVAPGVMTPHLYAVKGQVLLTVAGAVTARELVTVAESLRTYRGETGSPGAGAGRSGLITARRVTPPPAGRRAPAEAPSAR